MANQPSIDAVSTPARLSAGQLGEKIGRDSKQVNELFKRLGWIVRFEKGWKVTDAGARFGGENHRGSTAPYVKWPERVLQHPEFERIVNDRTDLALKPPVDSAPTNLSASQIGKKIGRDSRQVNALFERLGWTARFENGWKVTDAGAQAGGENHHGSEAPYVKWPETVLQHPEFERMIDKPEDSVPGEHRPEPGAERSEDGHYVSSRGETSISNPASDILLEAIQSGEITAGNISFDKLRSVAGRDRGCWDQLDRGRKILVSHDELDQYLKSYGPMTKSQWHHFLQNVAIPEGPVRVFDYGCGQGLATALLLDNLGGEFTNRVESVVLVEPSAVALDRASAVVRCYCGERPVVPINKSLDDLSPKDLKSVERVNNVHLLSNVLDIKEFDHFDLFTKMFLTKGRHSVLAVSHNRRFLGGTGRFRELEKAVGDERHRTWFSVKASRIDEFTCANGKPKPAISWELHVEVLQWICLSP